MSRAGSLPNARLTAADAILIGSAAHVLLSVVDGFFKEELYRYSGVAFWIFDFSKFVAIPVVVMVWLWRGHSIAPATYGLKPFRDTDDWVRLLGLTVFVGIVLYAVYKIIGDMATYWVARMLDQAPVSQFYSAVQPRGWLHFPVALYYGVTAGIAEEVFFRGLPLLYIRERFGDRLPGWIYVVVTSTLFALAHWENGWDEVIATFAFGVTASLFYLQLRDLRPLIAAHALMDTWDFS